MLVVYSAERAKIGGLRVFTDPFVQMWQHRNLLQELIYRDLSARFKGSMLGWFWAVFAPVILLGIYTFTFTAATGIGAEQRFADRALIVFIGLIMFNFCAEVWTRSPSLMIEHVGFLKRSILPSELLAWTSIARATAYAAISFSVFLVASLVFRLTIPWTTIFLPLHFVLFAIMFAGAAWFLSAMGAFTRDLSHLMASIVPVLMFISPVAYTVDDVNPAFRVWLYLNPMTPYIEVARDLAFRGRLPGLSDIAMCLGWLVFFFVPGWIVFRRYKGTAIDAI